MLIKTNRRRFMGALGAATLGASTLRFFLKNAEAQAFPQRFVMVYTPNGRDGSSKCTGTGTNYTLNGSLAKLNPMKPKFTVLDGLSIPSHGGEEHPSGKGAMLTSIRSSGVGKGASIDRYLAGKLTQGQSVYLGTELPNPEDALDKAISWHGNGSRNDNFIEGITLVMDKLFGNAPPPMGTSTAPTGTNVSPQALNSLAVNDYLKAEVERLQRAAPAAEFEKLNLHLQVLQQIRSSIDQGGGGGTPGGSTETLRSCDSVNLAGDETDQISLALAHALACGQTRIAVLKIGREEPHHQYSHWASDGGNLHAGLLEVEAAMDQHYLNFLGYLDSFQEGSGTLLDNTVVVFSSEVSNDYGNGQHGTKDMPVWLAGGLGGKIKTGQRIVAQNRTTGEMYKAIAAAMGVANASDYGDPTFAPGPLTDILL